MTRLVRWFLVLEATAFFAAALVHSGVLIRGYGHSKAGTAEGVIAAVLVAALVVTVLAPRASRTAGLGAQGFALLGTVVGLFMTQSAWGLERRPISSSMPGSSSR